MNIYINKILSLSSEISLKIATRTDVCLFKVPIYIFYGSAVGVKGLENDRECSWSWRELSRALLQERSISKLAPLLYVLVFGSSVIRIFRWRIVYRMSSLAIHKGYEEKLTTQKHRARVGPAKKKMKVAWTLAQKKWWHRRYVNDISIYRPTFNWNRRRAGKSIIHDAVAGHQTTTGGL